MATKTTEYMQLCLDLAREAAAVGEVPVGAVVVYDQQVIASARNEKESAQQATHHAEILALQRAATKLSRWRLSDCELYVSLEPCLMCAGAILSYRLGRLYYATPDPKAGAVNSVYQCLTDPRLNHRVVVESGVLAAESRELLQDFFRRRR